jgi:hypothetical protein
VLRGSGRRGRVQAQLLLLAEGGAAWPADGPPPQTDQAAHLSHLGLPGPGPGPSAPAQRGAPAGSWGGSGGPWGERRGAMKASRHSAESLQQRHIRDLVNIIQKKNKLIRNAVVEDVVKLSYGNNYSLLTTLTGTNYLLWDTPPFSCLC